MRAEVSFDSRIKVLPIGTCKPTSLLEVFCFLPRTSPTILGYKWYEHCEVHRKSSIDSNSARDGKC